MGLGRHRVDCSGSGYGHVAGACERGNEHSGSMKCGESKQIMLWKEIITIHSGWCCEVELR